MFFVKISALFNIKKILLITLLFLTFLAPSFSVDFPEKLSPKAKISLISIDYKDLSHSLFSKSCLRIYDKENQFDTLIDFAHFVDFDDTFFGLKFFFEDKKAFLKSYDFFSFFLVQSQKKNSSITEIPLDLSPKEVSYIYNFIRIILNALPNYSYDFDILTNNSETHISQILHDCYRMVGKSSKTERYSFTGLINHKLSYKRINDSFVLLADRESNELESQSYFSTNQKNLIIFLTIVSSIFFLVTVYQVLVYYFEKLHIISVYKSIQIFDFTLLFSSGLSGFLIIFMNLSSEQAILQNNFEYLYLFPLNVAAAFFVFKPILPRKIENTYWSTVLILSELYIVIMWIRESKFPVINMLFVLPLFLRVAYYYFITLGLKEGQRFKPYVLLVRFLDFISS